MEISKEFEFDSSHRLHNVEHTDDWNKKVFGKCNNEPSHGHRWKLIVTVDGKVNEHTGFVVNFVELKEIVNTAVIDKFDHHFINDLPEVAGIVPTCENMLPVIGKLIQEELFKRQISEYSLKRLTLYETPTSCATFEFYSQRI